MGDQDKPEKVVMVTGGCGFIPSNFVEFLLEESTAKIVCYDNLSVAGWSMESSDRCVFVIGDICNGDLLDRTLQLHGVNEIVHFAALTHVSDSFKNPQAYVESNVRGTVSLLEAVKRYGRINRFLQISTDEVYGDSHSDSVPKKEGDKLEPTNPYSASKAAAEKFVDVYRASYNVPACFVRMCNIYGPRQTLDKVVPKFINLAVEDKPFSIEGDGHQLRSWLYVKDACRAINTVLRRGKLGEIYNIGSSSEISVLNMAKLIKKEVSTALGMKF